MVLLLAASLAFGACAPSSSALTPPSSATVVANIAYATGSRGQTLLIDAYPAPASGARAVLMIHGGGWTNGNRTNRRAVANCEALQANGVACFSVDYELAPASHWRVQLENLADAVAWIRANGATYNADGERVSVWGHSAGAHLALMLAYREPGLESVVAWSPPTDLTTGWWVSKVTKLLGCDPAVCTAVAQDASPLYAAQTSSPPTLLAHSVSDQTVPYWHSQSLADQLSSLGAPFRFDTYSGQTHGGALMGKAFAASYSWWVGA